MKQSFQLYHKLLYGIAYHFLNNHEDAQDAVQETYIRFWKYQQKGVDVQNVKAFLSKTVSHYCLDRLKSFRHRVSRLVHTIEQKVHDLQTPEMPDHAFDHNELSKLIESHLIRLKPKQKACFIMRDIKGYPIQEIAELLKTSENNVMVNLYHARKNMRSWLKPYVEE